MTATNSSRADRMLKYIEFHGVVARVDLRERLGMTAKLITESLARPIADGVIAVERLRTCGASGRTSIHYRWARGHSVRKSEGPCLGGCGRRIVRDGVIFMCPQCSAAAASASPYAP